jgi:hypothetical protein
MIKFIVVTVAFFTFPLLAVIQKPLLPSRTDLSRLEKDDARAMTNIPVGSWRGTGTIYPANEAPYTFETSLEIKKDGSLREFANGRGNDPMQGMVKAGTISLEPKTGKAKIEFKQHGVTATAHGYCFHDLCHFDMRQYIDRNSQDATKRIELLYREFSILFSSEGVQIFGSDTIGLHRVAHFSQKMK